MGTYPGIAWFGGSKYSLVSVVGHVQSDARIVLCKNEAGKTMYASEREWNAASQGQGLQRESDSPSYDISAANAPVPDRPALDSSFVLGKVTRDSPSSDKIALLMSLFRGRTDVYAQGFVGKDSKDGKLSYWPKCELRFVRGACPKQADRKMTCGKCDHPRYSPLTPEVFESHCRGTDSRGKLSAIGIYVIENDRCYFLAADFDGAGWQAAASAYRDVCRSHGLFPCVERSRSGNGAHVWVFFDDAVDADVAKRLGEGLVSEARRHCTAVGFRAYDRLFPLQGHVAPGDLGNLIALPLQGEAFRRGNSAFVDDRFELLEDQCAYLSAVPKASKVHVEGLAEEFGKDPIGLPLSSSGVLNGTWAMPKVLLGTGGEPPESLPTLVRVMIANGIHIDRTELPASLIDQLCRLAAFRNPAFAKNLRLHLSVRDTPRFIDLSELRGGEIVLPRGCTKAALAILRDAGIEPFIADGRAEGARIHARFLGKLRPLQEPCKDKLVAYDAGVLVAPTGFGKSVIAASIIAHHQVSTLIVVPNTSLLQQWRTSLQRFLDIADEPPVLRTPSGRKRKKQPGVVGVIGGGDRLPSGIVDVATVGSLFESSEVPGDKIVSPFVCDYGMVIVDEVQHASASKLLELLQTVRAHYVYGMTATPKRDDGLDRIIFLECGPLRHKVAVEDQMAEQQMKRLLVPRFTRVHPDIDVVNTWHGLMDYVCQSDERNRMIVDDALRALQRGRVTLILTRRIAHAKTLAAALTERLADRGAHVALLVGGDTKSVKQNRLEELLAVPDDSPLCVVATGNYVGEGFDLDRLDTLLLAGPVAFEGALAQWVGRLHRKRKGKSEVLVLDYVDPAIPMFDNEWRARLRSYKHLGYAMATDEELGLVGLSDAPAQSGHLFGREDYREVLDRDFESCRRSLSIASSWCKLKQVNPLAARLSAVTARGVNVRVLLREPKRKTIEWERVLAVLRDACSEVCVAEEGSSRLDYVVCDEELVWYGSIAPLAYPRSDDCSIRFVSREVAASLLE